MSNPTAGVEHPNGKPPLARKTRPQRGDPRYGRSAISNGTNFLRDVDHRSPIYRRYRDIARSILVDQGGAEQCSESRQQLIRRFAAAAVLSEQLETRLVNGEEVSITEHATLSSTLVRLASRIGIDRVPKDVGPTLGDMIRADQEQQKQRLAREREARLRDDVIDVEVQTS